MSLPLGKQYFVKCTTELQNTWHLQIKAYVFNYTCRALYIHKFGEATLHSWSRNFDNYKHKNIIQLKYMYKVQSPKCTSHKYISATSWKENSTKAQSDQLSKLLKLQNRHESAEHNPFKESGQVCSTLWKQSLHPKCTCQPLIKFSKLMSNYLRPWDWVKLGKSSFPLVKLHVNEVADIFTIWWITDQWGHYWYSRKHCHA